MPTARWSKCPSGPGVAGGCSAPRIGRQVGVLVGRLRRAGRPRTCARPPGRDRSGRAASRSRRLRLLVTGDEGRLRKDEERVSRAASVRNRLRWPERDRVHQTAPSSRRASMARNVAASHRASLPSSLAKSSRPKPGRIEIVAPSLGHSERARPSGLRQLPGLAREPRQAGRWRRRFWSIAFAGTTPRTVERSAPWAGRLQSRMLEQRAIAAVDEVHRAGELFQRVPELARQIPCRVGMPQRQAHVDQRFA